jgi:hypothetical protein
VATQPARSKKAQDSRPAGPKSRSHVMASVKLDVVTYARVSAAAALAGMDKSAFMSQAIGAAVKGLVIIDRSRSRADDVDPSGEEDRPAA